MLAPIVAFSVPRVAIGGDTLYQQGQHCCPIADIGAATNTKCCPNSDDEGIIFAHEGENFTCAEPPILKIVATRCHILRLKCTKFDFGLGSAPDPAGGAYSAPQTPSWI